MRRGDFDERELERQLDSRGFMNRFYGRATRAVRKPWQMYPLGLPVRPRVRHGHRGRAARPRRRGRGSGLPFYAILCLPILFAAGMSLFDTIDGAFMNFAYGWAFSKPVRKIFYNITDHRAVGRGRAAHRRRSSCSSVLADKLSLTGGVWDFVANLDLNLVGYVIVGLFVLTWAIALAVWRFGRIEERWTANLRQPLSAPMTRRPARPPLAFDDIDEVARGAARSAGGRVSGRAPARARGAVRRRGPGPAEQIAGGRGGRAASSTALGLPQPRAPRAARRRPPRPRRPRARALRARRRRRPRVPRLRALRPRGGGRARGPGAGARAAARAPSATRPASRTSRSSGCARSAAAPERPCPPDPIRGGRGSVVRPSPPSTRSTWPWTYAAPGREQERDGRATSSRLADPAERDRARHAVAAAAAGSARHLRRRDQPRHHDVDADAVRAPLGRERARHADQPGLRRRVGDLARAARSRPTADETNTTRRVAGSRSGSNAARDHVERAGQVRLDVLAHSSSGNRSARWIVSTTPALATTASQPPSASTASRDARRRPPSRSRTSKSHRRATAGRRRTRAPARQLGDDRAADAAARAGDDHPRPAGHERR